MTDEHAYRHPAGAPSEQQTIGDTAPSVTEQSATTRRQFLRQAGATTATLVAAKTIASPTLFANSNRKLTMPTLRPSTTRGATNLGWLQSRHSFSFGRYQDPAHDGFGPCVLSMMTLLQLAKASARTRIVIWKSSVTSSPARWNTKTVWAMVQPSSLEKFKCCGQVPGSPTVSTILQIATQRTSYKSGLFLQKMV